jgi:Holliday junction resolvase RusA-like endonuclease
MNNISIADEGNKGIMRIEFYIPGEAKTAGSKNAFKNPVLVFVIITHANPKTKVWMDSVKFFAMKEVGPMCLITGPVKLTLVFYRDRPKSHFRSNGMLRGLAPLLPVSKPDSLKLGRAIEDSLTLIVWKNDSQVCHHDIKKVYCANGDKPGVRIIIETM